MFNAKVCNISNTRQENIRNIAHLNKINSMAEKSEYILRVIEAGKQLGVTSRQICLQCGVKDNVLSSQQKDITTKLLVPLLKTFPQINPYYILLGEGTPLIDEKFVNEGMIGRYLLQTFSELQVEVRQLLQENTILKAKLERFEGGEDAKKKRLPKRKRIELPENKGGNPQEESAES